MARLFPELDHLHFRYLKQNRRDTGNPTPDDWLQFLDKTGISWTVLYPTAGLAVGRIVAEEWAIVACKAYNTWLYERYLNHNPRLKGVGLIPLQNVDAAIAELRRAVKELGMVGGLLPSNGEAIQGHWETRFTGRYMKKRRNWAAPWPCTWGVSITWGSTLSTRTIRRMLLGIHLVS